VSEEICGFFIQVKGTNFEGNKIEKENLNHNFFVAAKLHFESDFFL